MLQKQIIRAPGCPETNFDTEPWNDESLVTPRHAVQMQWNDASVRKHCQDKKTKLFICTAEDRIGGRKLSLAERYGVAARNGIGRVANDDESQMIYLLQWKLQLA